VLIGVALDLPGVLNRHRFELQQNIHRNKTLQAEWQELGGEHFAFEVLDELPPKEDGPRDYRDDLAALEARWLDMLQPYGERGYHEKPKGKTRCFCAKQISSTCPAS
jgi:type II secretory pathway component PulK